MKTKLLLSILLSFVFCLLSSQVPQGFNYQAIARDGSGTILANQALPVKIAVMDALTGGNIIYEESFSSISSNQFGLITLVVGKGTPVTGTFSTIDWKSKTLYLRTKIEYPSGTWIEMGTSPIMSVPYSLVAKDVEGPLTKLGITGSSASGMEDALFEVKNKVGNTVFAVYNEGVRAYVGNGDAKGAKGGFSVGGYDATKGTTYDLFTLNTDSARIYVDSKPHLKGVRGGFSVGGYDMTKGGTPVQNYLHISKDSVRVYVDSNPATKGVRGGFAVGGYDMTKGGTNASNYLNIETNTTGIIDPAVNRILWYPLKNAFLTGRVLITDPANVGVNSFATGYESMAKGMYSQAMGYQASAVGNYSTAIGSYSVANNDNSFAFGNNATASNVGAYAFGTNVIASGPGSYALGVNCTASGENSFAFGDHSQATGLTSYAIGYYNKASGSPSYAFGDKTYSKAWGATTFGWYTKADAEHAVALGSNTISNSYCGLVLGQANDTTVMHYAPLPAGGSANLWLGDDPIFVIGNGDVNRSVEPPVVTSRSNAFTVLKNGNVGIGTSNITAFSGNSRTLTLEATDFPQFILSSTNAGINSKIWRFLARNNGTAQIQTLNDSYSGESTIIGMLHNGTVGIGTSSPMAKLEVVVAGNSGYAGIGLNRTAESGKLITINQGTLGMLNFTVPGVIDLMTVNFNNNSVGINRTPTTYTLEVGGTIWANGSTISSGATTWSDARYKTNIAPINDALSDILKLQGVKFDWKRSDFPDLNFPEGEQIGVIAQDIEKILPQLVYTAPDGYKSVSYEKFAPVFIEAIKDQQHMIEAQKQENQQLKSELQVLKVEMDQIKAMLAGAGSN